MPDGTSPAQTLRDPAALIAAGLAPEADEAALLQVAARYAIAVPPALAALIATPISALGDPIHRQFVPDPAERHTAPHEHPDPIADEHLSPVKGITHRYPDRALLKPLLACPVYCRFCFRREQVGPDGGVLTQAELDTAFAWLSSRPEIREIILTGGEPLMLAPRRLADLIARLDALPHLDLVRLHTRMPIADPATITETLAATLAASHHPIWLVLHINHPRELSPTALAAISRLRAAGLPLLSQSVLLRGVNDDTNTLADLFRALLRARIKPYYLHQLDPAPGTSHFHVPIAEGQKLLADLRGRISGMALPTYVLDIPGGHGKVPIGPAYLHDATVLDPRGTPHALDSPDHPA
jgi:lysine 2,3-aminomutase